MKIMVITSSPNVDGLTAACGQMASKGAQQKGAEVELVRLNDLNLAKCRACDNGWGICQTEHRCVIDDDFKKVHQSMKDMDAFVIVTPVYWGDLSESAKVFFDRVRRCEATKNGQNFLQGKPVICVAAAGGSGGGIVSCLASLKRFISHVGMEKFDLIGVTQKNREHKLETIASSALNMVNMLNDF